MRLRFVALFVLYSLVATNVSLAESAATRESLEHFEIHIRPLLVANCLKCHSGEKAKGGLSLETLDSMLTGGESGPAIVVGQPDESLLVSALRYESFEMPPDAPVRDSEVESVKEWIRRGAIWPDGARLSPGDTKQREITDEDRSHWSFCAVDDVQPPFDTNDEWSRNEIDRFVYRKLCENGIQPAPEADRRTLIRRVSFDLLGLPPTVEQVAQFVNDPADDAYEKLIDRMLSNPAYGERWGRHWLDLVRYGESDGYRADGYRPNAWRYRDYVIQSFNDDKPYDRFVREQLAGDEFYPDDPASWIGTAYLRLPLYEYNQRDVITQRQDILNDITDVTADVFLGLGMKCARCHDHKFDPILQLDYFRLQSHFAALIQRDKVPLLAPDELAEYERKKSAWLAATKPIHDKIDAIKKPYLDKQIQSVLVKFTPDIKRLFDLSDAERTPFERQIMYLVDRQKVEEGKQKLSESDAERVKELEKELQAFDDLKPDVVPRIATVTDVGPTAPPVRIDGRTDVADVVPAATEVLCGVVATQTCSPGKATTGRRTALANWLVDPSHPLTSRVAVNRMWQHHFGRGLVATSSDFGSLGGAPTHPELLDWLAKRFIRDGWSWKSMHRLMVTSATYRQSAGHPQSENCEAVDPANDLRWRWDVRRLGAEQMVDAVLSVSGQLNSNVGGASQGDDSVRRAVYRKVFRNKQDRLLALFDFPDGINSAPERPVTTTPTQALALLNHEWSAKSAAAMADRVMRETAGEDFETMMVAVYELAFSRLPSDREVDLAKRFVSANSHDGGPIEKGQTNKDSLTEFCHAILNANEFAYVD